MMADLISVQQAIDTLDGIPMQPRIESITLPNAHGRRLAEDIQADRDYPPFDKSVMDGYAVRSTDDSSTRNIVETVLAGGSARQSLQPNQAIAIMTGAPLPAGADAVIPVEQTRRDGETMTLLQPVRQNFAIARQGSEIAGEAVVLKKGTKLEAAQIAVAATVGATTIAVYARPIVSVLSTGDELIGIDRRPIGSQIRNSNSHMMVALLRQLGCEVIALPITPDDPTLLRKAIEAGLHSQALFITGGMSMGERDYIPKLLADMGLQIQISKLRIKPGKPFLFATTGSPDNPKCVFGLPGNPVSAFVCTVRLAARLISRMSGGPADPILIHAKLDQPLPANGNREFYLPGYFNGSTIKPLGWKSSADLFTLAQANALIICPENAPALEPGHAVTALPI